MLNQTNHPLSPATSEFVSGAPWGTDRQPGMRLAWLWGLYLLPLLVIVARLAHLQVALADEYARGFESVRVSYESIPCRDGRILSSTGKVLAYDIERFAVHMHYRWLEEPADPDWLRQQALGRLERNDRRDKERIEAEQRRVLEDRRRMWRRLAEIAGVSPEQAATERQRVQRRVERIVAHVEDRRAERIEAAAKAAASSEESASGPWWSRWGNAIRHSLTTAPSRRESSPLIVREELDYHPLVEGISLEAAAEIESHPAQYPGLRIFMTTRRAYSNNRAASHVIGLRTPIDAEEIAARREHYPQGDPLDYRVGDRIGRSGVERAYDRHLHGLRGVRKIVRDRRGEVIDTEIVREPRSGRDVVLTLDFELQRRAEQLLSESIAPAPRLEPSSDDPDPPRTPAGACIVALDVRTGAVIAAASAPGFDLMSVIGSDSEALRRSNEDPRRPFFPRMTRMTLPPGSVFKTLSAIALLEDGRIDPEARHECVGYLDRPDRHRCYIFTHYGVGHGPTNLSDALCRSCNVYFYDAARRIGPETLVHWAGELGFGRPTGIDLPGESGGNLPLPPSMRDDVSNSGEHPWYPGDTLGLAIGQSRLTVTPLQIARMMAVVANDGSLVTPHVVRGSGTVSRNGGSAIDMAPEPRRIAGLHEATLERVREGLERVVADPHGTGYKHVRLKEVAIAGKTGTAEVGGGRADHAWFAGYVPADRPRVAFVVVLEHAGSGGAMAGPVARDLVRAMLELGLVPSTAKPASAE